MDKQMIGRGDAAHGSRKDTAQDSREDNVHDSRKDTAQDSREDTAHESSNGHTPFHMAFAATMGTEDYRNLSIQLSGLIDGEPDGLANLANAAALLYHSLPDLNWAGFYLLKKGVLVLGPFQGKPACIRIQLGKGVCGTAAAEERTLVVPDVHLFPGHIACDAESASEIVIPLHSGGKLVGVLDLDSPRKERFTETDRMGLEMFAGKLGEQVSFPATYL